MSGLNLEDEIRWPSNGNLEDEILLLSAAAKLARSIHRCFQHISLASLSLASRPRFRRPVSSLVSRYGCAGSRQRVHPVGALRLMIRSEWFESDGHRELIYQGAPATVGKCASCFPAGLTLIYWQFNLIIN